MTAFLLSLVIGGAVAGDLLKAAAMRRLGEVRDFDLRGLGRWSTLVARSGLFWVSILAYAVSFFGFMALLSVEDVSFAVPATAAAYVVETIAAKFLLGEEVSARRWAGAALVGFGVAMIGG